jgi:acylphosphatase
MDKPAMIQKVLYKIRITGQVQGVGFRWRASTEARELGITGFIRNMSDGSVCIEAEGSKEQLDYFVEWCKKGPGYSNVEALDVVPAPPVNYSGFRIER